MVFCAIKQAIINPIFDKQEKHIMKNLKLGIHLKLVILCLILVLYEGVSMFYISDTKTEHSLEKQIGENLHTKSTYVMNSIDHFIYERLSDIQDMAEDPVITNKDSSPSQIFDRLNTIKGHFPLYQSFSYFDTSRVRIADTDNKGVGEQHSLSKYWLKLVKGEVVMDISKSESSKQVVMHFAATTHNKKGEVTGYVVSRVLIEELYKVFGEVVSETDMGNHVLIDLIDEKGTILYSNNHPELVLKATHPKLNIVKQYSNDKQFKDTGYFKTEEEIFLYSEEKGYMDYQGSHWALVMSVPTDVAFAPANDLKNTLLQFFIPILLLAVVLTFVFSKHLAKPLVQLTKVTKEYAKGNFDIDFSIKTNDEREELADNLQWMAGELKKKISLQRHLNEELSAQYKEVSLQKEQIESQQEEIKASLRYAKHMQTVMLPPVDEFKCEKVDIAVWYKPLKLVSGDFYYFDKVHTKEGKELLVASVIDCTGHGVPGAFMTIIANNLLQQIIHEQQNTDPSLILEKLHIGVKQTLRSYKDDSGNDHGIADGMDVALCLIDTEDRKIFFSGAYRPLVHIKKGQELVRIKGTRCSLGGDRTRYRERHNIPNGAHICETNEIFYNTGDILYMYSDGVTDQFGGGEIAKKFGRQHLKDILMNQHHLSIAEQVNKVKGEVLMWQGDEPQTDDMVLVGIKLT